MHNSTNSVTDFILYLFTLIGVFLTDNWYLILMVVFGGMHALVAHQRNKREKILHQLKVERLKRANVMPRRFDDAELEE